MERLVGKIVPKQTLRGRLTPRGVLRGHIVSSTRYAPYEGEYQIVPSNTRRVLDTGGKVMVDSVVIEPIPSNYGLITWDGSTLTVS